MKSFPIRMLVDTPVIVVLGDFKNVAHDKKVGACLHNSTISQRSYKLHQ